MILDYFCMLSGLYYYFRKEYTEAVENFQKSLDLNSFQLETLLRLGYSAIQLEAWEVAATTYWKYCTYETEVTMLSIVKCSVFPEILTKDAMGRCQRGVHFGAACLKRAEESSKFPMANFFLTFFLHYF